MKNMNGYTNSRMNLVDICSWLEVREWGDIAEHMRNSFTNHTWTKDGMIRTDVVKEIFDAAYGTVDMFRAMECDVITHIDITPLYEAHVD